MARAWASIATVVTRSTQFHALREREVRREGGREGEKGGGERVTNYTHFHALPPR